MPVQRSVLGSGPITNEPENETNNLCVCGGGYDGERGCLAVEGVQGGLWRCPDQIKLIYNANSVLQVGAADCLSIALMCNSTTLYFSFETDQLCPDQ